MAQMAQETDDALPVVHCLLGPTASGKTDVGLRLADRLDVHLVSVDSALVYRGMDIGTAKPSPETLAQYPHALVDIRDPTQPYTAADFRRDALAEIEMAVAQGRTPLLLGGTMMYFRALLEGIAEMPASDPTLRRALEAEVDARGLADLHAELTQVDPEAAAGIHPNNRQRVLRALEVYRASGVPISEWWRRGRQQAPPARFVCHALIPEGRAGLHVVIETRFDAMLEAGLIEEVRGLHQRGDLHPGLPAIKSVGYRQVWRHLDGETDFAAMREEALAATRTLARRQLTWLRNGLRNGLHTWQSSGEIPVVPGQSLSADGLARIERALRGEH